MIFFFVRLMANLSRLVAASFSNLALLSSSVSMDNQFGALSLLCRSTISLTRSDSGTCLSLGSDPCLHKLVEKVQSGFYVEMKELLGDNISLLNELESLNVATTLPALPGTAKPWLRGVSTASWPTLLFDGHTKSQETGLRMCCLSLERYSAMEGRGG